ncbi:MAG TPA: multidrug efflux RND transporter permease subunit [Acidobacteriota bacterium]|nr:multidrug efflux RND transporter permease subunit [Acidobacteriota bacterium]
MARFFIDHPVFAMVVAIVIVILGIATIPNLPIANYPEVVPPVVQISTNYLGGNAQDLEKTVTEPIEEQLFGLDGLLYFLSNSSNDGTLNIQVTFRLGTNPDIAVVQTQNRVNIAMPRLPAEVQRQGVTVKKVSTAFLTSVGLISTDNRYDTLFLTNYAQINLLNQVANLEGVGECRLGVNQVYSMRIWVNPDKMAELGITSSDVSAAIQAQNRQNPAGNFGQPPSPAGTDFQYSISAPGRLTIPEQFGDVVLRSRPDTSLLRIRDIGRVQLGAQNYSGFSRVNGITSGNLIVYLSPGANAVATADRIRKFMEQAKKSFPAGMDYLIPYDSTVFVHAAIHEVLLTLLAAVGLVIVVVFIFLQNWRATLIPLLTVPVAIVGTFALFPLFGFSINLTSMFGLVLAIGIVVDDAIVVVEAVQRNIDDGMTPRNATIRAMEEVSAPVVAIACVLAAVFIPVAFLGGISGRIYQQFALTIAISVLLSAFNALSLSPALSAMLLRPKTDSQGWIGRFFSGFNVGFNWVRSRYLTGVHSLIRKSALALLGLFCFWIAGGALFRHLPNGFLPDEDQGTILASIRLQEGASVERADAATRKIEDIVTGIPGVAGTLTLGGVDITTRNNSSNSATVVVRLKPWDERTAKDQRLQPILAKMQTEFSKVPEVVVNAFGQPPIQGLSSTGGFQFMLEDRIGGSLQDFSQVADLLVEAARRRPEITNVSSTFHANVPSYKIDVDLAKVETLGIPVTGTYDALQTFLGGLYVNDFNTFGRTWQVVVQAMPEFRTQPSDINRFYVRNGDGNMVPLGTVSTVQATAGPDVLNRYNRYRSIQILGRPAPGYSSGQASNAMEQVAASVLPAGYSYEWTGTTYQEKEAQGHEGLIFGFAAVLVFLSLAALYESWSIPFAVLLALPLGFFGALFAVFLRAYPYDIYTQIGIVTLIGLAAKNAILIVEYARMKHESGNSIHDSAMEAARLRLRPILMTSFAFILGVTPLLIASGAGGASRRSLGTAVFGGMNAATLLAIFIVPVLYSVIQRVAERKHKPVPGNKPAAELPE